MIVLDASIVAEWVLQLDRADAIESRVRDPDEELHAPHLLAVEVAHVIRRAVMTGEMTSDRGAAALAALADLDIVRHAHEPLLATMWSLRQNVTAYDGAYVALALALACPLVTFDSRLANAPHGAVVELIA